MVIRTEAMDILMEAMDIPKGVTDTPKDLTDILKDMRVTQKDMRAILMKEPSIQMAVKITKKRFIMNPKPHSKPTSQLFPQLELNRKSFFRSHIHYEEPQHIHTVHHHHIQKYTVIKKVPYEVIKEIKVPYKVYVFEKVPYKYYVKPLIVKVPIDYVSFVTMPRLEC